jgi:hypothetical protein
MGFRFSSFVAGAAENITDTLKEDEKQAAAAATFGVKALKENYDKVQAENRTLETKLLKNRGILKTFDPTATDAELFAAATNDTYMSLAVEAAKANPANFKVSDVVAIKKDNPSIVSFEEAMKAYTTVPEVSKSARQAEGTVETKRPDDLFGINILRDRASNRAATKAEEQTAKAMGVSIEKLRAASGFKRPEIDTGAEFNMAKFQKQPENSKEILDKLEVQEIQAAQQFGENSPERLAFKKQKEFVKSFEQKTDKSLEARADRLMVEAQDSTDPARVKEINSELIGIRSSIKNHKKLTTIADPKEKEATYNAMKGDVTDYVNTRMRDAKGTKWRDMVEFKTYTDEATGKVITSKSSKVGMTVEQQQEMFAAERKLTAQALKANGYTLSDGTPRTPVAERLMRNFNISAADLADPSAAPAQPAAAPAPAQPAPVAAPTAPTSTRPVAPTKGTAPPQAAIDLLKANPQIAADFEKKYPGYSAKTYLGK